MRKKQAGSQASQLVYDKKGRGGRGGRGGGRGGGKNKKGKQGNKFNNSNKGNKGKRKAGMISALTSGLSAKRGKKS